MAHRWHSNHPPRRQKRCWCGSGKKQKNCHPSGREPSAPSVEVAAQTHEVRRPQVSDHPWGMPGEEHKIVVAFQRMGMPPPTQAELHGQQGRYRVEVLLSRPNYPIRKEREHKFIDDVVGTSHIKIAKPEAQRGPNDVDRIVLQVLGKTSQLLGIPDKDGFLGKLVCELDADSHEAAEREAYGSVAPFLSAWSMNVDIPIHVETIQVKNLTTHVAVLRVVTPHFEMNFGGGLQPDFSLTNFASMPVIYREGDRFLIVRSTASCASTRSSRASLRSAAAKGLPKKQPAKIPGDPMK